MSPQDLIILKSLAAAIWPAATAMLGGWLGARVAFRRYKSERTFDRRIAWHSEMCQILHKMRWWIQLAASHHADGETEPANTDVMRALDLADEITRIAMESELYASQAAFDAIEKVIAQMDEFSGAFGMPMQLGPGQAPEHARRARLALKLAEDLGQASNGVAREMRRELGLSPVRYPSLPHRAIAESERFAALGARNGHTLDTPTTETTPQQ
jgi:hypothetical protein